MEKLAYQGEPGAFSDEACRTYFPEYEPVPFPWFPDAIAAVRSGECRYAFLPDHNIIAGPVDEVVELLAQADDLEIVDMRLLPIRQQLMAPPGATVAGLKVVTSHPMALGQCQKALRVLNLIEEPALDTAGAAREVAERGDPTRAAIAARGAAEIYGLQILKADIQDDPLNVTRFQLIGLKR